MHIMRLSFSRFQPNFTTTTRSTETCASRKKKFYGMYVALKSHAYRLTLWVTLEYWCASWKPFFLLQNSLSNKTSHRYSKDDCVLSAANDHSKYYVLIATECTYRYSYLWQVPIYDFATPIIVMKTDSLTAVSVVSM
jgi:hypothetical protein